MGYSGAQSTAIWRLARRQHGVLTHEQLRVLGVTAQSIKHRVSTARLHPIHRGVYALGRPEVTRNGRWMAAVLRCGAGAVLSHLSAAELWEIAPISGEITRLPLSGEITQPRRTVDVSVPCRRAPRAPGIVVHRRSLEEGELTRRHGIPVTNPAQTLIDIATGLPRNRLEAAIAEADKRSLMTPDQLRRRLDRLPGSPGVGVLRRLLDRQVFRLTDSDLERLFLPITRRAGLCPPHTGQRLNGFKVDFYWPDLGLVVETDGLRYHRTAAQQTRDRLRDQAHTAAGLTTLRFTHAQVRFEPEHVRATLVTVAGRLANQQLRN
jgi:very-short-patch-repair endonuclease